MNTKMYDLVVIGAGPGGEVGAIRAAQLGLKVALVEKNIHLGGTCLNVGCIPTKALIESGKTWNKISKLDDLGFSVSNASYNWQKIMERKEGIVNAQRKGLKYLMKKNNIDLYHGLGQFSDKKTIQINLAEGGETKIQGHHILIATGSRVRDLPFAKPNNQSIHTSDTILFIDSVPKTLAVIGGGVVGMEFASMFSDFGSEVTVYEMAPQILPFEDPETVKELERVLRKKGVKIKTGIKLNGIVQNEGNCTLSFEEGDDQDFEVALSSIGREPVLDTLNLEAAGVTCSNGFINVDQHYKTSAETIFAIGDVIETPALAHTASAEAKHAVEIIAGHQLAAIDYSSNPSAIYTYPEIASIGLTEPQLKDQSITYKVAKFPFSPMAKAKIEGGTEGFVKILYSENHKEILGVHIVGAKATELISEFVLGKLLEATVDEIGLAIHPHPTISETIMEAAHVAEGGAIHM